jgi:hypothetical protein
MSKLACSVSHVLTIFVLLFAAASCEGQIAERSTAKATDGRLLSIEAMTTQRSVHTATILNDGNVLITGGYAGRDNNIASAELYETAANRFTLIGNMSTARSSHTATPLPNGKILIAGGYNGEYLDTTEIYDPETKGFSPGPRMTMPRSGHAAVALNNGMILFIGGVGTGWTFLKSAEIYDPATGVFSAVGDMSVPRESHTATVLTDGRVLVAGGHTGRRSQIVIYTKVEVFDPKTNSFADAGDLTVKRHKHEAIRLADGRVLIVGGSDERDGDGAYNNAEIYNPADGGFTVVGSNMNSARYKLQGTAVLLADGRVLVAGGSDRAEIFDPATNRFTLVEGNLQGQRLFATATLLRNGSVLIAGGYRSGNSISGDAWIFRS